MREESVIFKNEDWELFCNAGTLSHKAGVPRGKIGLLVAKELTDNASDVGNVEIGYYPDDSGSHFYVKDDGPGLPGDDCDIAEFFSVKRPLLSTKRIRLPYRGALGNGLRVVAGAIISYGGSLKVSTRGRILKLIPQESGDTFFERIGAYDGNGTIVEVRINGFNGDNLRWARLSTCMTGGQYYKGKTSPYWYDSDSFYALLRSIQGDMTIREFISRNFDGCSGRKAGQIVSGDYAGKITGSISREDAEKILSSARSIAKEVKPLRLGYVGDLENSIAYHREEFTFRVEAGRGGIPAIIPAVIEFWAFESSDVTSDEYKSQFFVNRTPITGDVEINFRKDFFYFKGCGLEGYRDKKIRVMPAIWVNVITPYMPITTDGKEPNFAYLKTSIMAGIEKIVNRVHRRLPKEKNEPKETKYIKDVIRECLDEAIAKTSGNGSYRYSLRQLYYSVRPYVLEIMNTELVYETFTNTITDIEMERGSDLPGVYRDNRGSILHPHTSEGEIPLGTLNVESYVRPKYYFNKVLYIEKEGFLEIFKGDRWVEKNDCTIFSSKGYPSRAAKDLIDRLGDSEEDIEVFCIHDCDAAGTMIYQTLQEETRAS